jgi:cytochrome c5
MSIDSFRPITREGLASTNLFWLVLGLSALVLLVVLVTLVYSIVRFRGRPGEPDPPQVAGNRTIEIVWTGGAFALAGPRWRISVQRKAGSGPSMAWTMSSTEMAWGARARRKPLFQAERCIACHTIAGDGGQPGPDLATIGSRLSPEGLTWRIASGGNNMPAYGATLQPDEMTALVDFLSQLKAQP